MDSMRSLNRSLPSTSSKKPAPPEQLLQAFKQAALSVTTLYKSAASDHDSIRQSGYQDAIDDLLKFLDHENLGVQDGEGWRVRQWATARYDGSHLQQSEGEDEETQDTDQRHRSISPEKPVEEEEDIQSDPTSSESHPTEIGQAEHQEQTPGQPTFHFSAGIDNAMQTDHPQASSGQERSAPVRVEVINRQTRNAHKHNSRHTPRATGRIASQAAGSKRKLPFPDMSEIFNIGFDKKDGSDGSGGGGGGGGSGSKRSRFV